MLCTTYPRRNRFRLCSTPRKAAAAGFPLPIFPQLPSTEGKSRVFHLSIAPTVTTRILCIFNIVLRALEQEHENTPWRSQLQPPENVDSCMFSREKTVRQPHRSPIF